MLNANIETERLLKNLNFFSRCLLAKNRACSESLNLKIVIYKMTTDNSIHSFLWLINSTGYPNWTTSDYTYDYSVNDKCLQIVDHHEDFTQIPGVAATIVVFYTIVALLAVLGNILVIWTVWRNSNMHTVTNYYIVNLAISDFLVASLVMPLKLLEYTSDCSWHVFRTDALCIVVYYLLPIFVFTSVLTLVAISIER